ncbi:hypothetical protein [Vibrio mediterranei]|uniref:hypothetical protein n=1 Tax=Vibrio mediterranei TaxID=689 RepID=UPI004067F561
MKLRLAVFMIEDHFASPDLFSLLKERLDKLLAERVKKCEPTELVFAVPTSRVADDFSKYYGSRNTLAISTQLYPLDDPNNFFRSECMSITCDAAVIFWPEEALTTPQNYPELITARQCFIEREKSYKEVVIRK